MSSPRASRRWTPGCVVATLAVALVLPAAAPGAEVSVRSGTLAYLAGGGEVNVVEVRRFTTAYATGYFVYEDEAPLRAGRRCRLRRPGLALCGGRVRTLRASLGDGSDFLSLRVSGLRARIAGGDGADLIETAAANDAVDAGAGTDTVVGRAGNDRLRGGDGGDLLQGSDGADALDGASGDDVAIGESGDGDALLGGLGRDLLLGGGGEDTLAGNGNGDALFGGDGVDRLDGGPGDDQLTDADQSAAVVDCGPGEDRIRVAGDVQLVDCAGATKAPALPPAVWPPRKLASAAQPPPPKPKVKVRPRRRGNARYVSLRVLDEYYYDVTVRIDFFTRTGARIGRRHYHTTTRNPRNVYAPRPPLRAYRARGRCCF